MTNLKNGHPHPHFLITLVLFKQFLRNENCSLKQDGVSTLTI